MITFTFPKNAAVKFPDLCCCCNQAVKAVQPGPDRTDATGQSRSKDVAVPICPECETHRQKTIRAQRWLERLVGGGAMSAALLAFLMFSNKYDFSKLTMGQGLVLALSFCGALLLLLGVPVLIIVVFLRPRLQSPHLPGGTVPFESKAQETGSLQSVETENHLIMEEEQ